MLRLKELRKKKNMSQKEFGALWGASQNTVSNWENGNRELSMDLLISFAQYFGVSIDYLLGRDAPVVPDQPNALDPRATRRAEAHDMLEKLSEENYQAMLTLLRNMTEKKG